MDVWAWPSPSKRANARLIVTFSLQPFQKYIGHFHNDYQIIIDKYVLPLFTNIRRQAATEEDTYPDQLSLGRR
jgi:hypothetical protein